MAGNVAEWCWDWAGTPYGQPTTTNPTGLATGELPSFARRLCDQLRRLRAVRQSLPLQPVLRQLLLFRDSLCEGALVFAILLFNPFELVRAAVLRQAHTTGCFPAS